MLKGAIFDMDGLMFDTERLYKESLEVLIGSFGYVYKPEFRLAVAGSSGETMRRIIREYYPGIDADTYMEALHKRVADLIADDVPVKPGLYKILTLFKENGVRTAVASSGYIADIERNLRVTGLTDWFDAVISGLDPSVKAGKPAPDIFLYAAQRIGVAPEECYVFEDSLNGIRAGHLSGASTVMIPDTIEPTDEIRKICHVFPDLGAAADAIEAGKL